MVVKGRDVVSRALRLTPVQAQRTKLHTALGRVKEVFVKLQRAQTVSNGLRNHFYYILTRNLTTFCLNPESLNEARFKSNGLPCLVGEILR